MKRIKILLTVFLSLTQTLFAQEMPWLDKKPWIILFEDSCSEFDNNRWYKDNNTTHGTAGRNSEEPQIYTSDNVYISNGKIVLRTQRLNSPLPHPNSGDCMYNDEHYYTSGQIRSRNPYQYGYFEIYAKIPTSDGYWPAFWFHNSGNGWYNEIDVFEGDGSLLNSLTCGSWYCFDFCPNDSLQHSNHSFNCSYANGYHWYGVKWNSCKIIWYYDRQIVKEDNNDYDGIGIQHPMRMIMNTALYPPTWGIPYISTTSILPNYMYIDQINGYVINCQDKDLVINEIYDFNTYNYAIKKSVSLSGLTSLPNNSSVSLYASDFISLEGGFYVPLGTVFLAETTNECDCQQSN